MVWNLTANGRFSIKSAWNALRTPHPVVNWSKVIWFKHAVHRWSIIQWMTVLGSLSTRDRLLKLGMLVDARAQLQMRLTNTFSFNVLFYLKCGSQFNRGLGLLAPSMTYLRLWDG